VTELTCFTAYDARGEVGVNIDEDVVYRIGRAVAQHFKVKSVVLGFDARETSPAFAVATGQG
jgi:phosphomannomutase